MQVRLITRKKFLKLLTMILENSIELSYNDGMCYKPNSIVASTRHRNLYRDDGFVIILDDNFTPCEIATTYRKFNVTYVPEG